MYHELTETVYIYGGMLLKHDNPVVSDELFAFDLNDKQWNNLQSDEGSQVSDIWIANWNGQQSD